MSISITPSSNQTLGQRNNNPFNIRYTPDNEWVGQTGENKGFSVFSEPIYGIRAADKLINNYGSMGISTLNSLINRFAPPSENDTSSYINFIASETGFNPNDNINLSDRNVRAPILKAMAKMESGSLLSDSEIFKAQNFNSNQSIAEPFSSEVLDENYLSTLIKDFQQLPATADDEQINNSILSFKELPATTFDPNVATASDEFVSQEVPIGDTFGKAVRAGVSSAGSMLDSLKAAGSALLQDEKGVETSLENARLDDLRTAETLSGIPEFGEFLDEPTFTGFVQQVLKGGGLSVPFALETIATAMATGLVGVVGKAAITAGGKGALKKIFRDVTDKVRKNEPLDAKEKAVLDAAYDGYKSIKFGKPFKIGAGVGAFGTSYKYGVGESAAEFEDAGVDLDVDRAIQSFALGVPRALIETGGQGLILKLTSDLALKQARKTGSRTLAQFGRDVGGQIGKSSLIEGGTETLQDSIGVAQRFAIDPTYTREQALLRLGESAFYGASGGATIGLPTGVLGASAKALRTRNQKIFEKAENILDQNSEANISREIDKEELLSDEEAFTQPESLNDIEAQIKAAANAYINFDGETLEGKPAVWIDQSNLNQPITPISLSTSSLSSFDINKPGVIQTIKVTNLSGSTVDMYAAYLDNSNRNQGIIVSRSPTIVKSVMDQRASESSLALALGFTDTKPVLPDSVIEIVDKNKERKITYHAQEVDVDGKEEAIRAAERISGIIPNSEVIETSVRDTLSSRKIEMDRDEFDPTVDTDLTEEQAATQAGLTVSENRFQGLPLETKTIGLEQGYKPLPEDSRENSPLQEFNPTAENSLQDLNSLVDRYIDNPELAARIKENYSRFGPSMTGSIFKQLSAALNNQKPLDSAADIAQSIPAIDDIDFANLDIDEILPSEDTIGPSIFVLEETNDNRIRIVETSLGISQDESLAITVEETVQEGINLLERQSADNTRLNRGAGFNIEVIDYSTGEILSDLQNVPFRTIVNLGVKLNALTKDSLVGEGLTQNQKLLLGLQSGFRELQARGYRFTLPVTGAFFNSLDQMFRNVVVNEAMWDTYTAEQKQAFKSLQDQVIYEGTNKDGVKIKTTLKDILTTRNPIPAESRTEDQKLETNIQNKIDELLEVVETDLPSIRASIQDKKTELKNQEAQNTVDRGEVFRLKEELEILYKNYEYVRQTGPEKIEKIQELLRTDPKIVNRATNQARAQLLNRVDTNFRQMEGVEDVAVSQERAQLKDSKDEVNESILADRYTWADTASNAFNNQNVVPSSKRKPRKKELRPKIIDNALPRLAVTFLTRAMNKLNLASSVTVIDVSSLKENIDKYVNEKILKSDYRQEAKRRKDKLELDKDAEIQESIEISEENNLASSIFSNLQRLRRKSIVNSYKKDVAKVESELESEWRETLKRKLQEVVDDSDNAPAQVIQLGDQALIVTNKSLSESLPIQLASVAHELGHIFFKEEFGKIISSPDPRDKRLRELLWEKFTSDRQLLGNPEQYAPGSFKENANVRAFEEWYADNVASFLLNDVKKATNIYESYFKKIANTLKQFFREINNAFRGRIFQIPETITVQENGINKQVNVNNFILERLNKKTDQRDFDALFGDLDRKSQDSLLFKYHMVSVIKRQNYNIRTETLSNDGRIPTMGELFKRAVVMDKVRDVVGIDYAKKFKRLTEQLLTSGSMKQFNKIFNTVNNWYRSVGGEVGNDIASFWAPKSQSNERSGVNNEKLGFHRAANQTKNRFVNILKTKLGVDLNEEKQFKIGPVNDAFILAEDETLDTDKIIQTVKENPRVIKRIADILDDPENKNLSIKDVEKEAVGIAQKAVDIRNFFQDTIWENYITFTDENGARRMWFDIGRRKNFAPRTWNWQEVEKNQDRFAELLVEYLPDINNTVEAKTLIKEMINNQNENESVVQFRTQEKDSIPKKWMDTFEEYKKYVEDNKRLPTSEKLAAWGRQQQKDLLDGNLPNQEAVELLQSIPGLLTQFGFSPGMKSALARSLGKIPTKRLRDEGYLYEGGVAAIQYIHHVTRKVEFEKRGGYAYLDSLVEQLPANIQQEVRESFRGQLGQWGANMKPWMRTVNSIAALHTIWTTLLFVTISSLTDPAGIITRSKELSLKTFGDFFGQLKNSWSKEDNLKLAEVTGVTSAEALDTVFVSVGELDYANKWARTGIEWFLKYNLTTAYTRFTRILAVGMGREFILETSRKYEGTQDGTIEKARYERYLEELGLTPQDALNFRKFVESNDGTAIANFVASDEKIRTAIANFADESIIRPNPGERPTWANHPYAAMVWMLKSYFYSFGTTVLGGLGREFKNRYSEDGHFKNGALLAILAGGTLLPLAMIGLELRELTKYGLQAISPFHDADGRTFRSDHMDSAEYLVEMTDRAGLFGPWSLLLQFIESFRYGPTEPFTSLVPILDAFDDTIIDGDANRPWPIFNNIQ